MSGRELPPPFVAVEGLVNARSVGGFALQSDGFVKQIVLFRSGDPARITPKGREQLLALGVRRVFDFRADNEITTFKSTVPVVPGVEFLRAPVFESRAFDPVSLAARPFFPSFSVNSLQPQKKIKSFVTLYQEILDSAGPAFEKVFRHMLDRPEEPCLFHCTAGKDRTGLFTAILLMLLGVADEEITKDYALTAVGLEPYLPMLIQHFKERVSGDVDSVMKMASSKPETMVATLNMIREKYGSAEGWVTSHTSLTEQDLLALRQNLLITA
ncbi:protein-tyrosine phosphatase-like protein [Mycena galericulata]|nr:protein-tyrosine phosphatase-like protein [Mycena galericulata]